VLSIHLWWFCYLCESICCHQTPKRGRLKEHFPMNYVFMFVNNIWQINHPSKFCRQSRLIRCLVGAPQKGEKIGAWRLVFAFLLIGLCTIKRGTPRMVWVNSTFAQNHMHPLAIPFEYWWRELHLLDVAVFSRAETPAPKAQRLWPRNETWAPTFYQPAKSGSVVEPESSRRLLSVAGDSGLT
jgi:hypothetical protein